MVRSTSNILEEYKVEHLSRNFDIQLTDDHAGDISNEKDESEKKDAHEISTFFVSKIWIYRLGPNDAVCDAQDDVKKEDTKRTNDGRYDDSDDNRGHPEVTFDLVTDIARKVNRFTKDLLGEKRIDKSNEPNDADDTFVNDGWTLEYIFFCFRSLPKINMMISICSIRLILLFFCNC